jgi:hypothetical protein
VAVVVVALVAVGLSACVADPPPTMGTATAGNAQAVVTWQPPLTSPSPINAYVVTPWIGSRRQTPVVFNSSATTETVTGLINGVTYAFTVHAVNARGDDSAESGMSNPVSLTATPGLYGWGDDYSGQVGDGSGRMRLLPIQAGTDDNWTAVSAGTSHSVALKADGTLWIWGSNWASQLGNGMESAPRVSPGQLGTSTWSSVAAGADYTEAIRSDGTLWA